MRLSRDSRESILSPTSRTHRTDAGDKPPRYGWEGGTKSVIPALAGIQSSRHNLPIVGCRDKPPRYELLYSKQELASNSSQCVCPGHFDYVVCEPSRHTSAFRFR